MELCVKAVSQRYTEKIQSFTKILMSFTKIMFIIIIALQYYKNRILYFYDKMCKLEE